MKTVLLRDKKKRYLYSKSELSRKMLKYLLSNKSLVLDIRFQIVLLLEKEDRSSILTRIHNRCIKTNKGKSIVKGFRLSRIFFLNFSRLGQITGLVKKSW